MYRRSDKPDPTSEFFIKTTTNASQCIEPPGALIVQDNYKRCVEIPRIVTPLVLLLLLLLSPIHRVIQSASRPHPRFLRLLGRLRGLRGLLLAKLLVLHLSPVRRRFLVPVRLASASRKGRLAGVELVSVARPVGAFDLVVRSGLVAAEALSHVDHAAAAFAVGFLELLALCRERVDVLGAQALERRVSLDHDAVGFLEAERQRGSCLHRGDKSPPRR